MGDVGSDGKVQQLGDAIYGMLRDRTHIPAERGAVLYDVREPHRRPCCSRGERCLAHVVGVYEETTDGTVYYEIEDGTHTTHEWVHAADLWHLFEPAGWSTTRKPTYVLTREHGVEDHHDRMQQT